MNAHTPFDANKDWSNPYCQNSSNDPMVDALLGNAYHVVRTVYCNLGNLKLIYDFLNQYGMVLGVQSEAELKALTTKATFARIYDKTPAGDRQVTDYLYVEGDRTGVIPNDVTATGSWVKVATSNSGGSSGDGSKDGGYIPWVYNSGSANGGETTIRIPDETAGVPFMIVNGDWQTEGYDFEYDPVTFGVSFTTPLEPGDFVVVMRTGVPATPDNPNVSDWVIINWLYNHGAAVGGEQVIDIPYTFQSVPAVYKNGLRLYKGLTTESYTIDADNNRIILTEPLTTNDRLVVQLGGEARVLETVDHTIQEVARAVNVKDSEVILSTDTTQVLNGKTIVYDVSSQRIYGLPTLPPNVYISSVSGGVLTYNPGSVAVNLLPAPDSNVLVYDELAKPTGAGLLGIMPYGTAQDVIQWVIPDVFPGSTYTDKLQAAINYAVTNKQLLVITGQHIIDYTLTIPGNLVIDATSCELSFSALDYVFHPVGADSIEIRGGKFTATAYHTQRPHILYNNYEDALTSLPKRVVIKDTQCFNCGVGYIMVNCESTTSVHVQVEGNYVKTDDNTNQYITDAGMSFDEGTVFPYLMILGNTTQSVDIGTPRKSMFHVTGNTFDVFMQTASNSDIIKVGGSTIGGSFSNNVVINRNTECSCELDTFTGGLEVTITGNRLVNTAIKMMSLQFDGNTRVGLGGRSAISNNIFHFEENPLNDFAIFLRTSLVTITGNIFYYKGATVPANQRIFNFIASQSLNNNNNGFNGNLCSGIVISNNSMQMVLASGVSTALRLQCINTTDMAGAIISGNYMAGGFGMVIDARPERNRNVWNGNYIFSEFFTAEDVWRMNSAFVGSGNYIGNGYDNSVVGVPMKSIALPSRSDGTRVRVELDSIKRTYGTERCLYLLHIRVTGGVKPNHATYIIASGGHDATDRSDGNDLRMPIDQRLNPTVTNVANLQSCFRVGYAGGSGEKLVAEAMATYSAADQPPTKLEYAIVPLSTVFPIA